MQSDQTLIQSAETLTRQMDDIMQKPEARHHVCLVMGRLYELNGGPTNGGYTEDQLVALIGKDGKRFFNGKSSVKFFKPIVKLEAKASQKLKAQHQSLVAGTTEDERLIRFVYEQIEPEKYVIRFVLFRDVPNLQALTLLRTELNIGVKHIPVRGKYLAFARSGHSCKKWCATSTNQPLMTEHFPIAHG